MNKFLAGITLMSVACGAHSATMAFQKTNTLGTITKGMGHFRVYLSVHGVYSQRKVTLKSMMTTRFNAGYLYAQNAVQTLERRWDDAVVAAPAAGEVLGIAGVRPAGLTTRFSDVPAAFMFSGSSPREWIVSDGGGVFNDDDATLATRHVMEKALFYREANANVPTDKALVDAKEREAHAGAEANFEYDVFGVRAEIGLGYRVLRNLTAFLAVSYRFDSDDKKAKKNVVNDMTFETKGMQETFSAPGGRALSANLVGASFAYNEARLAQGMKATVKISESVGFMFGVDWVPCPMFAVAIKAGFRRYDLEVAYEDGALAYPGTTGMFVDAFTKDNGAFRLLASQKDTKRLLQGVAWPFVMGASASFVIARLHRFTLGMDYTLFNAELTTDGGDEHKQTDAEGSVVRLASPYSVGPTFAQMRDGSGVHQFLASGVTNTLTAKLEVQELGVFGGYTIAL